MLSTQRGEVRLFARQAADHPDHRGQRMKPIRIASEVLYDTITVVPGVEWLPIKTEDCVYTQHELDCLSILGPEDLRTVHTLMKAFSGRVEVWVGGNPPPAPKVLSPRRRPSGSPGILSAHAKIPVPCIIRKESRMKRPI